MKTGINILCSLIFLLPFIGNAQMDGGAFNSTGSGSSVASLSDYQTVGVNPANLGWKKGSQAAHIGFMDFGISVYSEPFTKKMVFQDLIGNSDNFSSEAQRNEAIRRFTDTELLIEISNTLFGFSYQDKKAGGFAFTVKQKAYWRSTLNQQASEFLFEGYNAPYFDSLVIQGEDTIGYSTDPLVASRVYNPTDLSHLAYNEYAFGYGRSVIDRDNFEMYAGIDIKFIQGYGILDYNSVSFTHVEGYQALAPFYGVKYNEPTPSEITKDGLRTAGTGWGFDLGLSFRLYDKVRIALSLNDIGSIKWDGNVYEGENVPVWSIETPGIDNYNIFSESGGIIADNDHLGKWMGINERTVKLPMHLRTGASYLVLDELSVGIEALIPMIKDVPGVYTEAYYAAGVQYQPAGWFQLSAGFAYGGGYGFKIPIGFTFRPVNDDVIWEVGFASRDLTTWVKTKDPMVSLVFGFLRFGFGG